MPTTTITLQDVASYSSLKPVVVSVDKPVAVFYGHNGVGKSTIARVLRQYGDNSSANASPKSFVNVHGISHAEFCVYDADYVDENFHTKDNIRGIFTLGKKSAEDLESIEGAVRQIGECTSSLERLRETTARIQADSARAYAAAKEAIWAIKTDFEVGPLRFCLEERKLRGDKARLLQHVLSINTPDHAVPTEDLLREANEVDDESAALKQELVVPHLDVSHIESNDLWASVIAPSSDSRLSRLIGAIKSEEWVRRGKDYCVDTNGICPFCQGSLPEDFSDELSKLFDTAYEQDRRSLSLLRDEYLAAVDSFSAALKGASYQDEQVQNDLAFQNATNGLHLLLKGNLAEIERKLSDPGLSVSLQPSSEVITSWRAITDSLVARISDYNDRVTNRQRVRQNIDARFWGEMRRTFDPTVRAYQEAIARLDDERQRTEREAAAKQNELKIADEQLRRLRAASTNIDASIDAINRRIKNIGITGFRIERDSNSEGYYHIARGSHGKVSYKSLSEGEKTLVTFLYFLESLEGSHHSDGRADKSCRIVVLDDPVSSLSHNHVYDIASIITNYVIDKSPFPQVIILTHSLFFYHELFKCVRKSDWKNFKCFRVTKNESTNVEEMQIEDVRNEYQSYWLVLKEAIAGGKYSVAMPIAMRYILEHYFSFIGYHDKLRDALLALGDNDRQFHAFYRYINRSAHSDDVNITDLPAIDPTTYLSKFREVFERTNQLDHFDHMMAL